ncbi:hypothetical protein BC830DRAFT_1164434 [Chytriomyces sp. MP71]|nr:hypothetical protein BC830DRAFT_1164434 [Chytriomyces sp. MP71]
MEASTTAKEEKCADKDERTPLLGRDVSMGNVGVVGDDRGRRSAWWIRSVAVAGFVALFALGTLLLLATRLYPPSIYLRPDPQPISGAFQFQATYSHLDILSEGTAGDSKITISLGTSAFSHVAYAIEADKGNEQAQRDTRVAAILMEGILHVRVVFPSKSKGRLHTEVRVTLPQTLDTFTLQGHLASLHYEGPNVHAAFNATVHTGGIKIMSPLEVAGAAFGELSGGHFVLKTGVGNVAVLEPLNVGLGSVVVETNAGAVDVARVRAATLRAHAKIGNVAVQEGILVGGGFADLETNNGGISGTLSEYASVSARANTGSIEMALHPGSITASVFSFSGLFSAATQMGSVQVSGAAVHKVTAGSGWVGEDEAAAKGLLDAETRIGSVKIDFL